MWHKSLILVSALTLFVLAQAQDANAPVGEDDAAKQLCANREPQEWFRLGTKSENDDCRNVIQCTPAGLQAIRCPAGLAFDIEGQTCNWRDQVFNCDKKQKVRRVKPLLFTEEPLCADGFLACGDGTCMERIRFCDGVVDCADESDESTCGTDTDPNRAPECDPEVCILPDCFCSFDGTQIPGNLNAKNIPQMITITFDDAINNNNINLYDEIYNRGRVNPNQCSIKSTFFVSHKYTNYSAVQHMHMKGHEIAVHSISHRSTEKFWSDASIDDWAKEMAGARLIVEKFANITDNSVVGLRSPYLRVGGNNQFTMMEEQAFLYDSTITAPLQNPPLWPYTMYFRMPHRCHGNLQKCPTRSHAVWEMVMNELDRRDEPTIEEDLPGCAMVDSCSNILDGEQFYRFLNTNFDRHYNANRAPLGLYFHSAWLSNNIEFFDAFLFWIDEILANHKDVYFVTMTQVIQWIQNPRTTPEALNFEPWKEKCNPTVETVCGTPNACPLSTKELPGETLRLHTCHTCPRDYPWLTDPTGEGRF